MADESAVRKATLALDLSNIADAVRRLQAETVSDDFVWDEELYSTIRDVRQQIISA